MKTERDDFEWCYYFEISERLQLAEEVQKLTPVAYLEDELFDLQTKLTHKDYSRGLEEIEKVIDCLYFHFSNSRDELKFLRTKGQGLGKIAEQHNKSEKVIGNCHHGFSLQHDCTLQKQTNHAVDAFDRLCVKSGMDSQIPSAGAAGMEKIHLRAILERMAHFKGHQLTDRDIKFSEEQDAIMLKPSTEPKMCFDGMDEVEKTLGRPLTALERCMPCVLDNMKKALGNIFYNRPSFSLHPIHRYPEAEGEDEEGMHSGDKTEDVEESTADQVFNSRRPIFANTRNMLDEIHSDTNSSGYLSNQMEFQGNRENMGLEGSGRFCGLGENSLPLHGHGIGSCY